ncbi:major facilitator superfamily MFS_1 [Deinococcus proteolyticus MRP]|uniref:Major facilitator superfamily MFS_1 n=1 Tax=Deinococcus proteolyticus (strain ATCC 35074 / DSM 20540 / JCM 6276 / NBRC 101906 / NCIMB 13154 / VKM Ac-1939 / CCM 2703 / MRP) TaxID=693977 RepID=F0RJM1_DEIPM|nr:MULTISPECIES: MFS transporter [Deinococcus]ADY26591.1 major facilitator superfamily MFS_1 [Deinococcus proteolyticus MRP]MCY1702715.1 MFS transporter [Deinococcus sp. SL84]
MPHNLPPAAPAPAPALLTAPPPPAVLSAFWFGTAFHWLVLLLIAMPAGVVQFMGEGAKGTWLGVLTAVGALVALVLPPIVGAQSDRSGQRLPYLRRGLAVNLLGLGVMGGAVAGLSGAGGFAVFVLGFLLVQFGNNYATAPYSALIPQLVPPEQRGHYSGVMATLQAVGQLLAAAATFAVAALHLPPAANYLLIAAVLTVPALITLRGVAGADQAGQAAAGAAQARALSLRELFAYQPFFWVFWTRVLFALGQYSVQPFLNYYNRDVLRQANPDQSTSVMLAAIIIASIFSALLGGRLSDRLGRKPVIYLAGGLMALAAVLLILNGSYTLALGIAALFGLGFGAFTSVDWALGSDAMPSKSSFARDMGIWHVAFVAPQFVSLPMGTLLDTLNRGGGTGGYTAVFGLAAVFFVAGLLLVRRVPERVHPHTA